jgi:archaellum component FlaC
MKLKVLLITMLVFSLNAGAQVRSPRRSVQLARESATAPERRASMLPIRRVVLYSNGVAYIERRGIVTGHAEIDLSFKQSQVDDVLKSMVVLDLGQGRIGAVSYNSSAPPSARMADIPFSIASESESDTQGGLAGVLSQLQGARVVVATANRTATGSILTVEERKVQAEEDKPGATTTTHALVIASEGGELASFDLKDVRSIKLVDEGSRRDVTEFASAAASARRRDAKTIIVTSDGTGAREMVVSYTIAAPIWKTTYRVVMDTAGQPFFQGWAIVDNVSEEDWENVQLSLVSGTPVSFIQSIQKPFYRYRPIVPIPADLQLDPQVYDPDTREGGGGAGGGGASETVNITETSQQQIANLATQRAVQSLYSVNGVRNATANNMTLDATDSGASVATTSLSDAIISQQVGIEAAATGKEVGDLFEYRIDQLVTVRRDRSALIPILQTKMEGERVSIFNEAVRADRPLGGMLLENTSQLTLEDGSMTVLDGDAYAGEALMERLKPGEKRLISFALDLGTLVTVRLKEDRAPTFLVKVANGVFQAHYYRTNEKLYRLTNQTPRPRVVFVEHPIRQGWELTDKTRKPDGKSARFYRFRIPLAAHESAEFAVTERQALMDSYALVNFTRSDLELFITRNYIDAQTRASLERLIDIKMRISQVDARLAATDKEMEEISSDQERLRENIKALAATTEAKQLIARYVAKANEQESRIEQLTKDRKALADERARLQLELDAAIRGLDINRNLTQQ